ncbi:methyltransferase [Clostridium akagii]|uniref:methyltransferase n=1 Tax=Clostridium akagii TaxID=91623 RepID=UPI00047CE012|nr:methyltransferase [Clostridium akagii]
MVNKSKNEEQKSKVYPQAAIMQLVSGVGFALAMKTAVDLNLFSLLKDKKISVEGLADSLDLKSSELNRLLRVLQAIGLLTKDEEGNYVVTEYGEVLIPGSPKSIYPMVKYLMHETVIQSMLKMDYSIKKGQSSFEKFYGNKYDENNSDGKSNLESMDKAMEVYSRISLPSLLDAYNFERFNLIVDVAGGMGQLITEIMRSSNNSKCVLFDLPDTIERAKNNMENEELGNRYQLVAGDMFKKIPDGGDLYIVSKVLNNWDDEHVENILKNISEAMSDKGRVIIIENLLSEDKISLEEAFRDLLFLVCTHGGSVRSKNEFERLIKGSGLNLLNVIKTSSSYCIIECDKAK